MTTGGINDDSNTSFHVPGFLLEVHPGSIQEAGWYTDLIKKTISAIEPGVIQKIAADLELSFVPEKEKESEVCFINSEEVRPEFRLSYAPVDLFHYICAVLQSPAFREQQRTSDYLCIPYPTDAVSFWKLVKQGEKQTAL